MYKKLQHLLFIIKNIGVNPDLSPALVRKTHLINLIAIISILACLICWGPLYYIQPNLPLITLIPICLYGIVLLCHCAQEHFAAQLFLSISISLIPVYCAIVYGDIGDAETMLMVVPMLGVLLFDKAKWQWAIVIINIIGYALIKIILLYTVPILQASETTWIKMLTGALVISLSYYLVALFKWETTKSEKALSKSQRMLSDAQAISLTGSWAHDFANNNTIWSKQLYSILEVSRSKIADMKTIYKAIHPDYKKSVRAAIKTLELNQQNISISFPIILPEGSTKWLYARVHSDLDQSGQLLSYYGTIQDINERVAYEQAIRESEQFFRGVFEQSPIAIVFSDPNGTITRMNAQFSSMLGYDTTELLLQSLDKFTHQDDLLHEKYIVVESVQQKKTLCTFEKRFIHKNGTIVWVNVALSFIYNQDQLKCFIINAIDITKRKHSEAKMQQQMEELQRANTELDQFAYIVSHDLKAPLRGISILAGFIEEDLGDYDNEEIKENFELLKGRVDRMGRLINGILMYSRVGRREDSLDHIDLQSLLPELIDLINPEKITQLQVHQQLPILYSHRAGIQQIFQNIISNAIKYNDKSHCLIDVFYKKRGHQHQFTIKDNGPGINEAHYDKVFKIFQTLQARDDFESTGIGLSIVKKRIETFGGKIWIQSDVGHNTSFVFTFDERKLENNKMIEPHMPVAVTG